MTRVEITIEVDTGRLAGCSDAYLALLWHTAQANPAPFGDWRAADVVKHIGWEIIRRWLRSAPVEMYHHQADHNSRRWLTQFARYQPPAGTPVGDDGWHDGVWVAKTDPRAVSDAVSAAVRMLQLARDARGALRLTEAERELLVSALSDELGDRPDAAVRAGDDAS